MVHPGVHQRVASGAHQCDTGDEPAQVVDVKWWEITFLHPEPLSVLSRAKDMMDDYCNRKGYRVLGYLAEFEPQHNMLVSVGVRYDLRKLSEGG